MESFGMHRVLKESAGHRRSGWDVGKTTIKGGRFGR